jgi:NTP pyrophosphatase (non-canonical NTP hydrolase)
MERSKERIKADIATFTEAMKQKLSENEHKGYWDKLTLLELLYLLSNEVEELTDAILVKDETEVMREAADVGNFAMMICTNASRQKELKR